MAPIFRSLRRLAKVYPSDKKSKRCRWIPNRRLISEQLESRDYLSAIALTNDLWTNLGPAPSRVGVTGEFSGRVMALAAHRTDPNTVYLGSDTGGAWKTTDSGQTWRYISTSFATNTIGAIAVDPVDANTVYVATGNWISGDGRGLYKSTDGGNAWTPYGAKLGMGFDVARQSV